MVGPTGDEDSEDRIHADWLHEEIVAPVFQERCTEFELSRQGIIAEPGRIDAHVSALLYSD